MRSCFILFLFLANLVTMNGQTVLFLYDGNGNRIRRVAEETPTEVQCNSPVQGAGIQNQNVTAKSTGAIDNSLSVYPNPTDGRFTIALSESSARSSMSDITIYSASGVIIQRLTRKESKIKVDLSDQEPGVYLLLVSSDDSSSRIKILLY